MKILLTGANGFVGHNVYKYLTSLDYNVEICIRKYFDSKFDVTDKVWYGSDLSNSDIVKSLMDKIKPDVIIHLAADPNTKTNQHDPYRIIDNNVKSTFNLLQYCNNNIKFILASTVLVYGNQTGINETVSCNPTSIYGASKLSCEGLLSAFSTLKNIEPVSLRMCATVGPQMTHGLVKDVIAKLKSDVTELELFGDSPGSIKPFIHVSDVGRAIHFFLKNDYTGTYNLCPNDNISVLDIAKEIMAQLEIEKNIKWMGEQSLWAGDNKIVLCSPNKIWRAGFRPECRTSISAIRRVAWEHK
jgi:UDP-glucose 4-epimerase